MQADVRRELADPELGCLDELTAIQPGQLRSHEVACPSRGLRGGIQHSARSDLVGGDARPVSHERGQVRGRIRQSTYLSSDVLGKRGSNTP